MQAITVYETLFWIGVLGAGVTSLLGFAAHGAHGGSHGGGHHTGHGGHGGHSHHFGQNGHAGHNHAAGNGQHSPHGNQGDHVGSAVEPLMSVLGYLSPLTLFSVSLGAGATGLLLGTRFSTVATAIIAIAAGLALFTLIVRPFMGFVRRFASPPATALAGTLAKEAIAQNRFDMEGRGIVTVTIDGQLVRLLAYLERDDQEKGTEIAPGDHLVVTQIDEAKNTCRVTKL